MFEICLENTKNKPRNGYKFMCSNTRINAQKIHYVRNVIMI